MGGYNAQAPLGLAPRLASAQEYVDHAAYWVDVLGLASHVVSSDELRIAGVLEADIPLVHDWLNGIPTHDAGKAGAKPSLWNSSALSTMGFTIFLMLEMKKAP